MTTWADKIFFVSFILIAGFIAFRPLPFFRALSPNRFADGEPSPILLRVIQVIAAVGAISALAALIMSFFWKR